MSDVKSSTADVATEKHVNKENDGLYQPRKARPKISICVPTFERSEFLDYLLANILEQVGEDSELVQVVVSDNFSQDSTWSIIDKFQHRSLNLKYLRSYKNLGFTGNLNAAVGGSNGKYCWLMGDDDALRPGAISFIAELLRINSPDVAISNRYTCDLDLKVQGAENFLPKITANRIFDFNIRSEMLEYLAGVQSTIGMFNFISNLVIRRDCWMRAAEVSGYSNTIFPHIFKIVDILRNQQGRLLYVPENTVFARTGNDRLSDIHLGSSFKSWQLHFSGNIEVADYYFSDDPEAYDAFLGPIRGIIAKGREYYISLAEKDGFLDEAVITLRKLKIAR